MSGSSTALPATAARDSLGIRWWPTALGLVFALGLAFGLGTGFATIVLVCAVIYLLASVAGRPGAAWLGFAASVPVIGIGRLLGAEWVSFGVTAALAVVLVVVGSVRRTWRISDHRRQLVGVAVFGAIAVVALAASAASPLAGGVLIAAGLLGHAAWDIVHHRRREVVTRPYAEFCAVLDVALAVAVIVLLLVR
jgi:hypothetical protein